MIQRIQSVFLLISALIMLILFGKPIAQMELPGDSFLLFYHNRIESIDPSSGFQPVSTWPVTLLLLIILGITLFTIFQFKNRTRQLRLCIFNILLHFGLVGLIYYFTRFTISQAEGVESTFLWPIVIPFISIILVYLALKRIQRDELLVQSIDRFRR